MAHDAPAIETHEHDGFRVEIREARGDIILNRPPLNVITMPQRRKLRLAVEQLDSDERIRVIVLRSEGENFSSGGDIRGFLDASPEAVAELGDNVASVARARKPVICAVRGFCFGVAFETALACDFRIASETARFALPEMRIGMIPGSGGSARLLHMIGISRTKDMVMRSRRISGRQGEAWGFITECVEDAELEKATDSLVAELVGFSPLAQRTIKRALNMGQHLSVEGAIELEGAAYGRLRSSNDFREGVESFFEKRKPHFTGS
ncbi:MAG: enoyl-CoA hydratase/isomerase family protein [Rhodobiaceae bacterium]|nr:enoyl-CoA hydratase/isomerase family protein [Rhodobiaceae bacterium]